MPAINHAADDLKKVQTTFFNVSMLICIKNSSEILVVIKAIYGRNTGTLA